MIALPVLRCAGCAPLVWARRYAQHPSGIFGPSGRSCWVVVGAERIAGVEIIHLDKRMKARDWRTFAHRATADNHGRALTESAPPLWQATEIDTDGPIGDVRRATLERALADSAATPLGDHTITITTIDSLKGSPHV